MIWIISACDAPYTWKHIASEPELPVKNDTEVALLCQPGYIANKGGIAVCENGALRLTSGEIPTCAQLGNVHKAHAGKICVLKKPLNPPPLLSHKVQGGTFILLKM